MPNSMKKLAFLALCGALSGCAGAPAQEEPPHHFSKDAHGNRIACYTTEVANEYECVPVYRRSAYAPGYYGPGHYDPYWSAGFIYGWPHYYGHVIVVDRPPPARPPPPHWRRRGP